MGIKRQIEENGSDSEKKPKVDSKFSIEIFVKNLKDPETSFLALSEFNEHIRNLSSEELLDPLIDDLLQKLKSNLDDILTLITEEKRKASENITFYRFLTTLMEYFSRKNSSTLAELVIKKFISIPTSFHTIYFMLSSHSTASHLKITLRFLLSMVQQNEFSARLIFPLIDWKRPCWKPLFRRRDIRDPEDVRYCLIKLFLSPLIYQNVDMIRHLIKEQEIFHEIFHGLVNDSKQTVEFILNEIRTNIIMVSGITKTDKLHLFDDRNLRSLLRLYNWTGQQKQKDMIKTKKNKNKVEESVDLEEMEVEDNSERDEVRKMIHTFMLIILNSKNYGINFFDPTFGTSTKNANQIIFKVITNLSNHFLTDEYAANLIVTCLTTCPDLLQPFFKFLTHEYISIRSKSLSNVLEFLCEVFQQQRSIHTWLDIYQTIPDSIKLTDIFINLTLPVDIMSKFDQVILKNSDPTIQLVSMKFLAMVLERVKEVLNIIMNVPLACDKTTTLEAYQQAIMRYIPKPDHFCDSLNVLKTTETPTSDFHESIGQYINLLKLYSSSCFMSMSAMNINLDILLTNSILNLLTFFKEILAKDSLNENLVENYFQCIRNILNYRESIDDATWARHNKELECTPIRMLFQLGKQFKDLNLSSEHLSSVIIKLSSMLNNHYEELVVWFYTWLKLGHDQKIEQFLSNLIERIILNPYPLVEKTVKDSGYSLMVYSALDVIQHAKEGVISNEIDEYLCHVLFQIYIGQSNRSSDKIHQYLRKLYLKEKKQMKIYQLLNVISSTDKQNEILIKEITNIEKLILSNIDLQKGPDNIQINLAIKLNIFKIFALNDNDISRLIGEMIQCLNIVLLLNDPHRSFEVLFDTTIEHIQSYSSTVDTNRILSLLCQLINGLDITHQQSKPLKNSKVLLKCLEYEPNNYRLIYFTSNYLSSEYRLEFLNTICQTVNDNLDILKIILNELKLNKQICDERYLDAVIDGLKDFNEENISEGIQCCLELIERMKKISNKNWKNILRLKQKLIFKLTNKDYPQIQTRILIAKFIVRTVTALRSNDRIDAINRLIHKSSHSLLLHAHIFYDLLNLEETIKNDEFISYLKNLLDQHSAEPIVFDLFRIYHQRYPSQQEQIFELLKNESEQENLPIKQTNQLLLMLKLFPDSIETAEKIYKSIMKKTIQFFETSNENNQNMDEWLTAFEQCTTRLFTQTKNPIDLYELINHLLKYFSTFTTNSLSLLKTLVQFFVSQSTSDQKHLSKLFANLLKHKNFLEQLSSNRSILVDILSLFVSHYNSLEPSITIDCSKHFPMLLSIYNPTLSSNDQHTLACMYTYEKQGYSMKSAFIWGEAALKFYSTTTDTKSILLQASKLEQVMSLLDDRMMRKSILFYPVTRRLRTIEPKVYDQGDQIYDPSYLIPVFYHSLGPECVIKCQDFVEKHCLAYCLMALSSRCGLLRAVVYNCLSRFEQHLVSQRFYCKEQILTMFTLLKQSIKKENLKLAPIVALFLSKLVDLFTHPESKIYRTITRFLLKQPYIDLIRIPLFGELFHSSSIEYKYERGWILNLLKHGIKDSIDYTLCTKAYVFKTLMTFYDCSLCDDTTKIEILNVFHSTSKLQDILMSLLFDYGFLLWLQTTVKNCSSESLMVISMIIQNICLRLSTVDNQVQLLEFHCLVMLFIRRLKNETKIESSIADIVVSTLLKYQEYSQSLKNSMIDMKHIVDSSTIVNKISLLSCFC